MSYTSQGEKIALAAREWLGTPHVNGARVKGKGVDCGMLLIGALEDAGVIKKDAIKIAPYSPEFHLHNRREWMKEYVEKYCKRIEGKPQKGDFMLYQYGRCCSHAGIYIGAGCVIHAQLDQGVILSSFDDVVFYDAKGKSRLRGIYRFHGGPA